jgi:hypothetical protein
MESCKWNREDAGASKLRLWMEYSFAVSDKWAKPEMTAMVTQPVKVKAQPD